MNIRPVVPLMPAVITTRAGGLSRLRFFWLTTAGLLIAAAALTHATIPALAGGVSATSPVVVSGRTPLPSEWVGEPEWCGSSTEYQDWEQDNALAVSPTNGNSLVAAWQQDALDATVVGYSTNRGTTWRNVVPKTTLCTWLLDGRPEHSVPDEFRGYRTGSSALDPWVSIGPAPRSSSQSISYLTSVLMKPEKAAFALVVNRSLDEGKTWSDPLVLDRAAGFPDEYVDTSYVVADPNRPGHAYALWVKGDFAFTTRDQFIRRTITGGDDNWANLSAEPVRIPSTPGRLTFAGRLLVMPGGTLVNVAAEVPPQTGAIPGQIAGADTFAGPTTLVARRSTDGGKTWLNPVTIAEADPLRLTGGVSALAPDGTIFVIWARSNDDGSSQLMYSKSTDGGQTWCSDGGNTPCAAESVGPRIQGPFVFGNLAVARDGTVAVTFYDHRDENPPNNPPRRTDLWLRHSHNGGNTWEPDVHLAGPFDQTAAPNSYIGDYQGLAPLGDGFATTFVLARPLAQYGDTDVFSATLRLE